MTQTATRSVASKVQVRGGICAETDSEFSQETGEVMNNPRLVLKPSEDIYALGDMRTYARLGADGARSAGRLSRGSAGDLHHRLAERVQKRLKVRWAEDEVGAAVEHHYQVGVSLVSTSAFAPLESVKKPERNEPNADPSVLEVIETFQLEKLTTSARISGRK